MSDVHEKSASRLAAVAGATALGFQRSYAAGSFTGGVLLDGCDYNHESGYDYVANIASMPETGNGNGSLLRFLTAPSSASSPLEAMRITKNGNVGATSKVCQRKENRCEFERGKN